MSPQIEYYLFLIYLDTITAYMDLQTNSFVRTRFSRLQTAFGQQTMPSSTSCTALCSQNVRCESVNYNPSLNTCQFSEVPEHLVDSNIAADKEWHVYSRRTGKCHFNGLRYKSC